MGSDEGVALSACTDVVTYGTDISGQNKVSALPSDKPHNYFYVPWATL